jgi:hypothetical protein
MWLPRAGVHPAGSVPDFAQEEGRAGGARSWLKERGGHRDAEHHRRGATGSFRQSRRFPGAAPGDTRAAERMVGARKGKCVATSMTW